MPSGKVHTGMTIGAAATLAVCMWQAGYDFETIRLTVQGCLTGVILSPDLDVDGGFLGHSLVRKFFGEIVERIWRAFWLPYAIFFSHRSDGSHFPVISTLGRVGYLYGMYYCICIDFNLPIWVPDKRTALLLFIGLVVSDTLHYIADKISTYLKKRRRNARIHFPMSEMFPRRRSRT